MASHMTTISSKGQLVIPAELRAALHIKPGMRFAVLQEGNAILLRPVDKSFIDELCGITGGGPSMTEMLLEDRRKEDKRLKW